jgi:hypothetical protein
MWADSSYVSTYVTLPLLVLVRSGDVSDITTYRGESNKVILFVDLLATKPTFSFPCYFGIFKHYF